MSARRRGNKPNPFDEGSKTELEEFADEIYGASDGPELDTGRVVARPISLFRIWADVTQPRRAIPASVRGDWVGDPHDVPTLITRWHEAAEAAAGIDIHGGKFVEGRQNTDQWPETLPVVTAGYVDLLRLAATIRRDGLINPIGVAPRGNTYLIETGERRWLAHHVLHMHFPDDGYDRIVAVQGKVHDVWRQATENTARRDLNAIGMARQLSLLIMDVRRYEQAKQGAAYDDFETLIAPGGCDRRFYAQVANGNLHRIPKGDAERIQVAMGLSEKRLADYRSLLRLTENEEINDILWIAADIEDWPDKALREIRTLPQGKVQEVLSRDVWTLDDLRRLVAESKEMPDRLTMVNLSPLQTPDLASAPADTSPMSEHQYAFEIGQMVQTPDGGIAAIERRNLNGYNEAYYQVAGYRKAFSEGQLEAVDSASPVIGDLVLASDNVIYRVVGVDAAAVNVVSVSGAVRRLGLDEVTVIQFVDGRTEPYLNKFQMAMVKHHTAQELDAWNNRPDDGLDKPLSTNPQEAPRNGLRDSERETLEQAYFGWMNNDYDHGWFVVDAGSAEAGVLSRLVRMEMVDTQVYGEEILYRISMHGCSALGRGYPPTFEMPPIDQDGEIVADGAVLEGFAEAEAIEALLEVLRRFCGNPAHEAVIHNLMTMERDDILEMMRHGNDWGEYLDEAVVCIQAEVERQVRIATDYLTYLDAIGRDLS